MLNRYLTQVLVTSLILLSALGASPAPGVTCPPAHASPYSPRVIRGIRATLQLRVLEARRARLSLAEAAIVHRMTIDELLGLPDDAAVLTQGPNDRQLKHFHARGTSTLGRSEDENVCW